MGKDFNEQILVETSNILGLKPAVGRECLEGIHARSFENVQIVFIRRLLGVVEDVSGRVIIKMGMNFSSPPGCQ